MVHAFFPLYGVHFLSFISYTLSFLHMVYTFFPSDVENLLFLNILRNLPKFYEAINDLVHDVRTVNRSIEFADFVQKLRYSMNSAELKIVRCRNTKLLKFGNKPIFLESKILT